MEFVVSELARFENCFITKPLFCVWDRTTVVYQIALHKGGGRLVAVEGSHQWYQACQRT